MEPTGTVDPPEASVVVPPPSEKAVRYHRSGNVIWAVEQVLGLALPAALLLAGCRPTCARSRPA